MIEQGRFRKLEGDYEGILSYSNSAKDLSVVKPILEQHENRVKLQLNVIEKDAPPRLRYLVKPKTLGMVRIEPKTSSFASPSREHVNRIKPECDDILRINYHS